MISKFYQKKFSTEEMYKFLVKNETFGQKYKFYQIWSKLLMEE